MSLTRWLPNKQSAGLNLRRWGTGVVLLSAGLALTACGGTTAAPAGSPPSPPVSESPSASDPPPSPSSPEPGLSKLTIVIKDGETTKSTWHLTCDPSGGDHPDPAAACRALQKNAATALPATSKNKMCTQMYGGSSVATITGTYRGEPVKSRVSLTDGCEIGRWNSLLGLLPKPTLER